MKTSEDGLATAALIFPPAIKTEVSGSPQVDLQNLPDEKLMAFLQAGCDDALAILYDRYHRLVLSVGLRILRDFGEAEDVMQTVFLEIYRVAAQFDAAKGSTKVWLLQYAYTRSLNRRQYLKKRGYYQSSTILEAQAETPSRCGSSRALELPEVRRLISEALSTLNKAQRQTLCLAYFEGLTLREISQQNGESLDNVRHHYYRGLKRMRSLLEKTMSASERIPLFTKDGQYDPVCQDAGLRLRN